MYRKVLPIVLAASLLLAACGQAEPESEAAAPKPFVVGAVTVAESRALPAEVTYPGLVAPESDISVTAATSGTASGVAVNLGDSVVAGQQLLRVDDPNGTGGSSSAQVDQSRLAADQARTALQLARTSYASLQASSEKDLAQSKAAADQAERNIGHTETTFNENIRAAQLSYESAQLATSQAKATLDNRTQLAAQATADADTNARTTAATASNTATSILEGLNTITGFDDREDVPVSYDPALGALDSSTKTAADLAYDAARRFVSARSDQPACQTAVVCLDQALALTAQIKNAADATTAMLEKSVSGSNLSQAQLDSLKASATGSQSQLNASIAALNAAKQNLQNTDLNNKTTLQNLTQAFELAQKQEASALQNLSNLRAQNASQTDQVGTSATSARDAYEALQLKIKSQLDSARSQVQQAEIAYQNALVGLQSSSNNRVVTAPISGKITAKNVSTGDTVAPGQTLFTISKTGNLKVAIYVDELHHALIRPGLTATISDSSQRIFPATVMRVAPDADSATKRFLVELVPAESAGFPAAGAVVDVRLAVRYQPLAAGHFFLPLSSVTLGQNASTVFTIKDGLAHAEPVRVVRVVGEYAELEAELADDARLITTGARAISEGARVQTQAEADAAHAAAEAAAQAEAEKPAAAENQAAATDSTKAEPAAETQAD